MWKEPDGRDTVPAWCVSQRVFGAIDGVAGTVVSVGPSIVYVRWRDADGGLIAYPVDTAMVRAGMPWE